MELHTYTGLWRVERRLYKFYDMALPYPVSFKQLGAFFGFGVPWVALLLLIHFPGGNPWWMFFVAPPIGFAVFANQPVAEGKTLIDLGFSNAKFYVMPRRYAALAKAPANPERRRVWAISWRRTGRTR